MVVQKPSFQFREEILFILENHFRTTNSVFSAYTSYVAWPKMLFENFSLIRRASHVCPNFLDAIHSKDTME